MNQLTIEDRKLLAGFLGDKFINPTHGSCCTCQTCGHHHDTCICRDFDTWEDFGALKKKLVEKGMWNDFSLFSWGEWTNDFTVRGDFAGWLIDEHRFPALLVEAIKKGIVE